MKLNISRRSEGGALVMTIIIGALVGSVMCSFLVLIGSRNQAAMRALSWNSAIPVLEAGIEEALTHLHDDAANPRANQWQRGFTGGEQYFWKHRQFPDGSYFYVTNFHVSSTLPYIISAGYVPKPLKANEYISRVVKVTTTNPPTLYGHAIASVGAIKLGGGAVVDGYVSTNGFYDLSTNRNANGSIATDSQQANAIDVGSAHVYGAVVTGPGGTVSVAGGSVGDLNWNNGIEPNWTNDNMNVSFQSNSPPTGSMISPISTPVGGSNITYLTFDSSAAIYKTDSFISNDKTRPMIVTGHSTLYVTGDFIVNNSGYVYIMPGASLTLYVGGRANVSGGGVVNGTGSPANLSYYGLSSNTFLNYSGHADFVGTINAPQANFNIGGGASVFGAVISNTFTGGGGSSVHYDQALGRHGIFLVTSWRELAPSPLLAWSPPSPKPNPFKPSSSQ